jgi:hypothetical protein
MAPAGSKNTPEVKAWVNVDQQLEQAGWLLQDRDEMNDTRRSSKPFDGCSGVLPSIPHAYEVGRKRHAVRNPSSCLFEICPAADRATAIRE